jgi:hypothetical protein
VIVTSAKYYFCDSNNFRDSNRWDANDIFDRDRIASQQPQSSPADSLSVRGFAAYCLGALRAPSTPLGHPSRAVLGQTS